jgi:hypothetical protein
MPASLIEIIQLPSGEIEVRRVDSRGAKDGEPVVKLTFSEDAIEFMGDATMEIARVMVQAGLDAVSEIMDEMESLEDDAEHDVERPEGFSQRILH